MLKILHGTIAALVILLSPVLASSVALADNWGCSAEKCLVSCQKAGGNCSLYYDKALRDKKVSKVCK